MLGLSIYRKVLHGDGFAYALWVCKSSRTMRPMWGRVVLMGLGKVWYSSSRSFQYWLSCFPSAAFLQYFVNPGLSNVTALDGNHEKLSEKSVPQITRGGRGLDSSYQENENGIKQWRTC